MFKGLLFCILLTISIFGFSQNIDLSSNPWFFKSQQDSVFLSADVPGNIYLDLHQNSKIGDPFLNANSNHYGWVDSTVWQYQTTFKLDSSSFPKKSAFLIFKGLDTYANVYVNGHLVLQTDNMFRSWQVDVFPYLKVGNNILQIEFFPANKKASELALHFPYNLPGDARAFTRKAAFQWGWDWAPTLIGCGIWKEVELSIDPQNKIENAKLTQHFLPNGTAEIKLQVSLKVLDQQKKNLKVEVKDGDSLMFSKEIKFNKLGVAQISFQLPNPKLWWPNETGDAHLYSIKTQVLKDDKVDDQKTWNFGIRTIDLVQQSDSIGSSFYFKVNGKEVFAKGANWVPVHHLKPEQRREQYLLLLKLASDAHLNMLRVWGGGVYESDDFYELCDSLGIMVWQDFMFAGNMYPADPFFMANVKIEAEQQIKRISLHPSLALWCGNNEISEAWYNWGWQKQFGLNAEDSTIIWADYQKLFDILLAEAVKEFDGQTDYHPSSPANGWGLDISYRTGDVHYWGVWWGKFPFETYKNKTGRFNSEFGFQAFPSFSSLNRFIESSQQFLGSEALKAHQKHRIGFETIDEYLLRDLKVGKSLKDEIYLSQYLQAKGLSIAFQSHRLAMPRSMGSLVWQLNDAWPVVSWSLIDFYSVPKLAYYQMKRDFAPVLLAIDTIGDELKVSLHSFQSTQSGAGLEVQWRSLNGDLLASEAISINHIKSGIHNFYFELKPNAVKNINTADYMIYAVVKKSSVVVCEQYFYPLKWNLMLWQNAEIKLEVISEDKIRIFASKALAKGIFLESEGVIFSDNGFDLLPETSREIDVLQGKISESTLSKIKIHTLNQYFIHE